MLFLQRYSHMTMQNTSIYFVNQCFYWRVCWYASAYYSILISFSLAISPSKYSAATMPWRCRTIVSRIVLADGQADQWSPMGEEARGGVSLGVSSYQSPLLQGLIEMGRVKENFYPARIVFLFLND